MSSSIEQVIPLVLYFCFTFLFFTTFSVIVQREGNYVALPIFFLPFVDITMLPLPECVNRYSKSLCVSVLLLK